MNSWSYCPKTLLVYSFWWVKTPGTQTVDAFEAEIVLSLLREHDRRNEEETRLIAIRAIKRDVAQDHKVET